MKGARYFLRNFTATAVREHLRSQIEDSGGSPELTKNELELVRFICEGSFDWRAFLAATLRRPGGLGPTRRRRSAARAEPRQTDAGRSGRQMPTFAQTEQVRR